MAYLDSLNLPRRRVLVVGLARSGIAAAQLLRRHDYTPVLSDRKIQKEFAGALDTLIGEGMEVHLGTEPDDTFYGCEAVVISPGVPIDSLALVRARTVGLPVIGELELGWGWARGDCVAITGTNGKTTTTTLMGEILKNAGRLTHVVGNIGYPISAVADETGLLDALVVEVSSFQLESVHDFAPDVAAVLNVTPDHLNRHGDMETYAALKAGVFKNQTAKQAAVLNLDDPYTAKMVGEVRSQVGMFSRRQPVKRGAWVRDNELMLTMNGEERALCTLEEIKIPGPHNLENALAACVMAGFMQIPAPVIRHTLRSFAGVEHRMEFVREIDSVKYINDSKGTNVDATLRAIEAAKAPTVLILGGSDKGVSFDALALAVRDSGAIEHVLLIGQTAGLIGQALEAAGYGRFELVGGDMEKAVARAGELAVPGGQVLLSPACASFDMFEDFEHRGRVYKEIVKAL